MKETVVITGASRGIGQALAQRFSQRGHALVTAARSAGVTVECDLATPEGREKLAKACPERIGGLVNNAGFGTAGEFEKLSRDKELQLVRLNCEAVVDLTHLLLPRLAPGSFIVNVASTAAFQPVPLFATYAASKAFVLSLSEALADELAPRGIHVMALCPGVTESGFQKEADVALTAGYATADEVADFALRALDARRRVAIHGAKSSLLIFSQRFAPRALVVKAARKVMEPWFAQRH